MNKDEQARLDDFRREDDRNRQQRWRQKQDKMGIVEVRLRVPEESILELKAFAASLRTGDGTPVPSTGKQKYQAQKLAKEKGIELPSSSVFEERHKLDIWMICNS